jgi:two-component system OmpR family sensor kinase/two-component system sensor histidine kinase BaeS
MKKPRFCQHFPPPNWQHGPPPSWSTRRPHKRRSVLLWFGLIFGGLIALFTAAIIIILSAVYQPLREILPHPDQLLLLLCGVPLGFTFLASLLGGLAFRRLGSPLAEVMAAADAVADGDLNVRVRENVPGEFGRLGRSFNRMTEELARAEQQRRALTADVAHELRTPIHILQGNLEGMLDGVYEASPEQLNAMLEETHLLSRLVEDLRTLSLAESGQLALHVQTFSALDLLEDVKTSFSSQAAAAEVALRVECRASEDQLTLTADPDRLDQVLSNLVANALRHTPAGGSIVLGVESLAPQAALRLTVQDTGSGIAPTDLPFIFDRFWRGDRSRTRQEGAGSGLGLAIARQLVQAHAGQITVQSQPGLGTAFTIDLPIQPPLSQ